MKQIFQIKENEIHQKYSCNSSCSPGCRIFHQKHNWVKSVSGDILAKLNNIKVDEKVKCEKFDQSFGKFSVLQEHNQIIQDGNQCEPLLEKKKEMKKHKETSHGDDHEEYSNVSYTLMPQSGSKSNKEEMFDVRKLNFEDKAKHLCSVCLLSFQTEDKLKQHMPKHVDNT